MGNNTIVNLRKSNYEKYNNRKRVFLPFDRIYPQFNNNHNFTSTTWLPAVGSTGWRVAASPRFKQLKSSYLTAPVINTAAISVGVTWRVPDDFYGGEKAHVWLVFAKYNSTTSSGSVTYSVQYNDVRILDYNNGTGTPEPMKAIPANALDTAISEAIYTDNDSYPQVRRWCPMRGERGTINAGKIHHHDFLDLRVQANAATNGASIMVLGLEIEYEVRCRGNVTERYSD